MQATLVAFSVYCTGTSQRTYGTQFLPIMSINDNTWNGVDRNYYGARYQHLQTCIIFMSLILFQSDKSILYILYYCSIIVYKHSNWN